MKKMSDKIKWLIILCVVAAVAILSCLVFYFREGEEASPYSEQTDSVEKYPALPSPSGIDDMTEEMENENTVVWTIPEYGKVKKSNVDYLNELLEKDGYHLKLAVRTADEMEAYNSNIEQLLRDGRTDIVFTGMCRENEQMAIPLIKKGYLEKLDPYLDTSEGKKLKQAFHQVEWDTAEYDGNFYVVPSQEVDRQIYVAFNKKYIPEEQAKKFSGDWTELLTYLSDDMEKENGFLPLAWTMNTVDALEAYGYQQMYGLVGKIGKGTFCHPTETQEYHDLLKFLHTAIKEGYLGKDCNLIDLEGVSGALESGKYAVLAGYSQGFIADNRDNLTVVPVKNCKWRLDGDGCTGICSLSKKKEKAFLLLSLLYTDERYANALAYGKEGRDYEVRDGYISVWDDEVLDPGMYGIYDKLLPMKGDEFTPNVHENKKQYFDSEECQKSEFLKFHPDVSDWADEISEIMDLAEEVDKVCRSEDFEKAYQEMKEKQVKESQEFKKYLQKQFDQWKENQK